MPEPRLEIRRRNLPHWMMEGSTYFVTFRAQQTELNLTERTIVLRHLRNGHEKFYILAAAVVMPDHVHILLRPQAGYDLSRIMKGIKGVSAHLINQARNSTGTVWQIESWDRIMRNENEFLEKLKYMADNPVKAGLVPRIEDYDSWFCAGEWL